MRKFCAQGFIHILQPAKPFQRLRWIGGSIFSAAFLSDPLHCATSF